MPKEPKIKELMKSVGEIIARSDDRIDEYEEYALLADAIKSLRKENKRLKKCNEEYIGLINMLNEKEAKRIVKEINDKWDSHASDSMRYLVQGLDKVKIGMDFNNPLNPVAEFKCAKTNKPTRSDLNYHIICRGADGQIERGLFQYGNDKWLVPSYITEVIAFTETDPSHIVDALNKDK